MPEFLRSMAVKDIVRDYDIKKRNPLILTSP